jgi:oligopeptide/dipeptide ABC transporter ATP-binding protein
MADLLAVEGLRVRFRTMGPALALARGVGDPFIDAVLDVTLSVPPGGAFALVGESGSGKSTLARAVFGLARPAAGSIRFDGHELVGLGDRALKVYRRSMAMMFQDPVASLSPRLTVRSLVAEPFRIHGLRDRDLEGEATRLLELVGLSEAFLGRYPHELSGGQARRVGVARALALSPRLVVADEPTAGLDVSVQGEVLNLMSRLRRELGLTYVIITHNLAMVRHVGEEVGVMYLGRLVERGPTRDVFTHPAHPYTHGLLAAVPQPDPDRRRDNVELTGEIPSLRTRPSGCEFHTRCPFVAPRCRTEPPSLAPVAPGRLVRCHFPLSP